MGDQLPRPHTRFRLFDKTGKPLSPPDGYNFNDQLGRMQGIIATPGGDIWALDMTKAQLIHFPKGDPSKGELLCQNKSRDPLANPCKLLAPFRARRLTSRIASGSRAGSAIMSRGFRRPDPTKAETFKAGFLRKRSRRRQPRQCLGHQQAGQGWNGAG